MPLPQSYGIFSDPVFIRKNSLLNFLYSHFPSKELLHIQVPSFSDQLRVCYHNLSLENDQKERTDALKLVYSTLISHYESLNDLDWYYCERITIHFANFLFSIPNQINSILKRN